MAVVTFKLNDFGIASMSPYAPRVWIIPEGAAVLNSSPLDYLVSSKPIRATLDPDGETFTVHLWPSPWTRPMARYRLVIEWLNRDGVPVGRDAPDWVLHIPAQDENINLADIIDLPTNPYWVWTGLEPPVTPTPGTWWMNPETGDLFEWS